METAAISTSVIRSETLTNSKTQRVLDNDFFISLTKEIQNGMKAPRVSRSEVLAAINSGNISPDVVEDLEDAILGQLIEEAHKSERVSMEEVFKVLRQ